MFPLGELESIDGKNAAVVSSGDYPNVHKTRGQRIFVDKIPGDVYTTYTLLTSAEQGFKLDQRVHITNGVNRDIFSANLTSPFSHLHGTRAEIKFASVRDTVGNEENPVFLIQFSGK